MINIESIIAFAERNPDSDIAYELEQYFNSEYDYYDEDEEFAQPDKPKIEDPEIKEWQFKRAERLADKKFGKKFSEDSDYNFAKYETRRQAVVGGALKGATGGAILGAGIGAATGMIPKANEYKDLLDTMNKMKAEGILGQAFTFGKLVSIVKGNPDLEATVGKAMESGEKAAMRDAILRIVKAGGKRAGIGAAIGAGAGGLIGGVKGYATWKKPKD